MAKQMLPAITLRYFYTCIFSVLIFACISTRVFSQSSKDYLNLVVDKSSGKYGYVNALGDTVIPFGKYSACFTDKFDKLAIVFVKERGFIGIDRNENILFNVFVFDNGPDYPSDGLFRIVKDGKIGYANLDGKIVIQPKFDCAYPFKHGNAKVSNDCKTETHGEHHSWTSKRWSIINKQGQPVRKYVTRK